MTDLDPVVRARELAAQRADYKDLVELRELLPVLCDIIDELRVDNEALRGQVHRYGVDTDNWRTECMAERALNARLTATLREAVEKNDTYKKSDRLERRPCRYCGMYEQYSHLYTCPVQMLAELSVTPETQ